jgi:hypothetical protein
VIAGIRSLWLCALALSCTVSTVETSPERTEHEPARPPAPQPTGPAPTGPPAPAQRVELPSSPPTVVAAPSGLELVDAGAQPRRSLRPHLTEGAEQHFALTIEMRMGVVLGASKVTDAPVPTVRANVSSRVVSVADDGSAKLRIELSGVTHEPAADASKRVVEATARAVAVLDALVAEMDVGKDGVARAIRMTLGDGDPKDVRHFLEAVVQMLAQLYAPRPDAPVGTGARWRTVTALSLHGMDVQQSAQYRVVELADDRARVEVELAQGRTAAPSDESYAASARADITLDPAGLAPLSARSTSRTTMHTQVDARGQRQPAQTRLDVTLQIDPAP